MFGQQSSCFRCKYTLYYIQNGYICSIYSMYQIWGMRARRERCTHKSLNIQGRHPAPATARPGMLLNNQKGITRPKMKQPKRKKNRQNYTPFTVHTKSRFRGKHHQKRIFFFSIFFFLFSSVIHRNSVVNQLEN